MRVIPTFLVLLSVAGCEAYEAYRESEREYDQIRHEAAEREKRLIAEAAEAYAAAAEAAARAAEKAEEARARLDAGQAEPQATSGKVKPKKNEAPYGRGRPTDHPPARWRHKVKLLQTQAEGGGLDQATLKRILLRRINELKFCYEKRVHELNNESFGGTILVGLKINPGTSAEKVTIERSDMGDAQFEKCVLMTFRRIQFPRPESNKVTFAKYKIGFVYEKSYR